MTLMIRARGLERHASLMLVLGILATEPAQAHGQDEGSVRMVPPDGEGERYWPRWRGPSGQGIVEDTDYPDTWSDTTNVLWKTSVPGSGHSSPIVWGDHVFVTSVINTSRVETEIKPLSQYQSRSFNGPMSGDDLETPSAPLRWVLFAIDV